MLRVLLVGILLSTPLLADHLIGSWNNYDPDEGDIYLRLRAYTKIMLIVRQSEK